MSQKGLLTSGLCALSLSVSLIAGCASPVTPPPTDAAAPGAAVPGAAAPSGETPAANPAAPVAPAAVTPVTLSGKASFRGEALSGYTVSVLDAQSGQPVTLTNDLNGATGLTVLNQNLVTDAQGAFSFQVVGLQAGQALRVQVKKGNAILETVVTSDLTALGAKKLQLLQANGNGLDINELTTAIAKIARGVILTTRVLKAEDAAPVLAKLAADLSALTAKFEKALQNNPTLANTLVSSEGKESVTVKSLVDAAGVAKELTKAVADRVAEVAKVASTNGSSAASDPAVQASLAKVEFYGTVLAGTYANSNFTLSNALTGKSVDASTGNLETVTTTPTSSGGSGSSGSTTPSIVPDVVVDTAEELTTALAEAVDGDIIGLGANITGLTDAYLTIDKAVTLYGGAAGYSIDKPVSVNAAATLKNIAVTPGTIPSNNGFDTAIYVAVTGVTLDGVKITGTAETQGIVTLGNEAIALTVKNSTINSCVTGIYLNPGTVLTASGNTISGCEAGIGTDSSDLRTGVTGNTFTGNAEDIGLYMPVVTATSTSALRTKLMADNTGAMKVNLYGYIANAADLRTRLGGDGGSTLLLNTGFVSDSNPIVIDRADVTVDGNGASLTKGFEIKKGNVTVKNLTITGQGYQDALVEADATSDSAIYVSTGSPTAPVTLENVTINYNPGSAITNVNAVNYMSSYVVVKDCNFSISNPNTAKKATGLYGYYGTVEVTGTTFAGDRGIVVVADSQGVEILGISGNTFNNNLIGTYLYGRNSVGAGDADATVTRSKVLSSNTFGSMLDSDDKKVMQYLETL